MRCPSLYRTATYLGLGIRANAEAVSPLSDVPHRPTKFTDLQRVPRGHRTGPWQLPVTPPGQRNRGGRWQAAKVSAYAEPEQISDMEQSDVLMRLDVMAGWESADD